MGDGQVYAGGETEGVRHASVCAWLTFTVPDSPSTRDAWTTVFDGGKALHPRADDLAKVPRSAQYPWLLPFRDDGRQACEFGGPARLEEMRRLSGLKTRGLAAWPRGPCAPARTLSSRGLESPTLDDTTPAPVAVLSHVELLLTDTAKVTTTHHVTVATAHAFLESETDTGRRAGDLTEARRHRAWTPWSPVAVARGERRARVGEGRFRVEGPETFTTPLPELSLRVGASGSRGLPGLFREPLANFL